MNTEKSPRTDTKPRKPDIIEQKKRRGEWAESVFMSRAQERGLPVSKPWGEMCPYDFVVGTTGRFVSVQVKSTLSKPSRGYACTVQSHQPYTAGSFDFLAAYVIPADVWYIIPAASAQGLKCITFYPNSPNGKYEQYREAWQLMHVAIAAKEETNENASDAVEPVERVGLPRNALERMEASFRFMKSRLEQ